jgi:O-antigen ligase
MAERIRGFLTAKNIFFILFLIGITIQWPFSGLLPLELALIDLILVVICLVWIVKTPDLRGAVAKAFEHPLLWILAAWAIWALFLWIVSSDWAYLINETRWLFLGTAAFAFLMSVLQSDWRRMVAIFLVFAAFIAAVTDLQGLTGFFKPPFAALMEKEIWVSPTEAVTQPVAVGFFRHPNVFGAFVLWPLLLTVGFLSDRRKRLLGILGILFFGASLYLSYYRTLFLGVGFALAIFILIRSRLSPRLVGWLIAGIALLVIAGSVLALQLFPNLEFFTNLWFRVRLWESSLNAIQSEPIILLLGSGFSPSAELLLNAARSDPHNAFLYMTMHYGLPGLLLFLAIIGLVIREGWKAYRDGTFLAEPLLAALWSGLLAWFLTDLIDSRLSTPEWQMMFMLILALFFSRLKQGAVKSVPAEQAEIPLQRKSAAVSDAEANRTSAPVKKARARKP